MPAPIGRLLADGGGRASSVALQERFAGETRRAAVRQGDKATAVRSCGRCALAGRLPEPDVAGIAVNASAASSEKGISNARGEIT